MGPGFLAYGDASGIPLPLSVLAWAAFENSGMFFLPQDDVTTQDCQRGGSLGQKTEEVPNMAA